MPTACIRGPFKDFPAPIKWKRVTTTWSVSICINASYHGAESGSGDSLSHGSSYIFLLTETAPRRTGDIDETHLDLEVGQTLRGYSFKGIWSSIRGRCYQEYNFSGLATPKIIPLGSAAGVACQLRIGSHSFIDLQGRYDPAVSFHTGCCYQKRLDVCPGHNNLP